MKSEICGIKPKIRKSTIVPLIYECVGGWITTYGMTPEQAYGFWKEQITSEWQLELSCRDNELGPQDIQRLKAFAGEIATLNNIQL